MYTTNRLPAEPKVADEAKKPSDRDTSSPGANTPSLRPEIDAAYIQGGTAPCVVAFTIACSWPSGSPPRKNPSMAGSQNSERE